MMASNLHEVWRSRNVHFLVIYTAVSTTNVLHFEPIPVGGWWIAPI